MPSPPPLGGPFVMPMMRGFVPKKAQPWIYLAIAFCFQMSGGVYSGALSGMMGDTCLMREDVLMVVLCSVVGVNMPFPLLFRLKFRFANKSLLLTSALAIAACDVLITTTENVPTLCLLGYIAGFFKLCGTFECMSNIQLWMTPKRDFAVFFPLLYCVVLGNMSLSPWITSHLCYSFQQWQAMNWFMAGVMLMAALTVAVLTRPFCPLKRPLPLISVDWLGCLLWSALMIEVIFVFNYGEHYNWLDGAPIRRVLLIIPVTAALTIGRMLHIRHPYIDPMAWRYKRLLPLLALFAIVELVSSTPKVLQTALTGSVLHYGTLTTSVLYIVEWVGTLCGCLFVLVWVKVFRRKFTTLLTVGMATLLAYEVAMYFVVSPGLPLDRLYVPIWCRTFGVGIFFTTLTIYLEEVMPFSHFFMGLTMVGFVRNGVMETICSGIYGYMMRSGLAGNTARALGYDGTQLTLVTVKQLYGATCIIATAVLVVFLLWNIQPVRVTMKRMPSWGAVGRLMRKRIEEKPE